MAGKDTLPVSRAVLDLRFEISKESDVGVLITIPLHL